MRFVWLALLLGCVLPLRAAAQVADASVPPSEPDTVEQAEPERELVAPAPVRAPKVVAVVIGDPDELAQAAARRLDDALVSAGAARIPSDEALRAALRGEAATPGDGLDEVRRERRRLGLGDDTDAEILQRLGRRAGAVLVVALRETARGIEASALDVATGRFYEGERVVDPEQPDAAVAFVRRRAEVSARQDRGAGAVSQTATSTAAPVATGTDAPSPATLPPAALPVAAEPAEERNWFEENWPYLAAGVLLAGAIVFVVVAATDDGNSQPVLRFQPGSP